MSINYLTNRLRRRYKCGVCGCRGVKLWRQYNTFLNHLKLMCVSCAGVNQQRDTSSVDRGGFIEGEFGRCDQIGWMVPAVPTVDGRTFWGYTSVPDAGVKWWRTLKSKR